MRMLFLVFAVGTVLLNMTESTLSTEPLKLHGRTMGTHYSIVVDSPNQTSGNGAQLQAKIDARLLQINAQMSTWDNESEISRFNDSTSTDWFDVSSEFARVTAEAKKIHQLSNGAFDPSVAPLITLWGFGDNRKKNVPDAAAIEETQKSIGMQHLEVRINPPALKKHIPGLQINLSAIAKGYGVDAIAELLITEGQPSFVVDIGGETRTGTAKASGDPWKLGVESPLGGLHRVIKLTESSIATSGDYRNFFTMNGEIYSHAIDPATGWPVKNPPASVSVLHPSCMTADAWATTMMVLGPEKGIAIANAKGLSVMFQNVQGDSIEEASTGEFAEDLPPTASSDTASDHSDVADEHQPASARWFPFAAAAVIFLIAVAGMAVGTILQNKSLKGSCGGLASMPGSDGRSICELCTIPKDECTNAEIREKMQAAASAMHEEQDPC